MASGFKVDRTGRSTGTLASKRQRKAMGPPAGTNWVWLIPELLESEAWRSLRINERRILDRLMIEHLHHGGQDNGQLRVSYAQFQKWGVSKNCIAAALRGLKNCGLLEIHQTESNGDRRGYALYRLTFQGADGCEATNEWRQYRRPRSSAAIVELCTARAAS